MKRSDCQNQIILAMHIDIHHLLSMIPAPCSEFEEIMRNLNTKLSHFTFLEVTLVGPELHWQDVSLAFHACSDQGQLLFGSVLASIRNLSLSHFRWKKVAFCDPQYPIADSVVDVVRSYLP